MMVGITNATETRRFFPSLYKRGDLCTFLSGGWANNTDVDGYTRSYGTGTLRGNISYYNTHVAFQTTEVSGGNGAIFFFATKKRIDLTNIDTIQYVIQEGSYNGSEYSTKVYVCPNKYYPGRGADLPQTTYPAFIVTTINSPTGKTIELPVKSLEGEYYVGINVFQWSGGCYTHIEIAEINLIRE